MRLLILSNAMAGRKGNKGVETFPTCQGVALAETDVWKIASGMIL